MAARSDGTKKDDSVVIKKYANRRLYNTATSKYIVLTDVVEMVNNGIEFVIEDAKSGKDITREILNQIIFEQEIRPKDFLFPLEFQKQLIRMYGDAYGKMFPDYLTQSINFFNSERVQLHKNFQDMIGQNADVFFSQAQEMAQRNMELFQKSWNMFGTMSNSQSSDETSNDAPAEPNAKTEELDKIQKQIDALQEQLKSLK